MPKYPDIKVKLTGGDGNAFGIMGAVSSAMCKADVPKSDRDEFMQQAMSGDYDNLLRVCMEWVDVS